MTRNTDKPRAKSSAALRKELSALMERCQYGAEDDDGEPAGDAVLPAVTAVAQQAGPKRFKTAAQNIDLLAKAAPVGAIGVMRLALEHGVHPDADPKDDRARVAYPRALGSIFETFSSNGRYHRPAIAGDRLREVVALLLEHEADPERVWPTPELVSKARKRSALDAAVQSRSIDGLRALVDAGASSQARDSALVTAVLCVNHDHLHDDREPERDMLRTMMKHGSVDGRDRQGMSPLHAAAITGDAETFDLLLHAATETSPKLPETISYVLHGATGPGGGIVPSLRFVAGATPFEVARLVEGRLRETAAAYAEHDDGGSFTAAIRKRLDARIDGLRRILSTLETGGHATPRSDDPLPAPLGEIRDALRALAAHRGGDGFDDAIRFIDWSKMGPWGYLTSCVDKAREALRCPAGDASRHLLGAIVDGSLNRDVMLGPEAEAHEPDSIWAPGSNTTLIWPENYPEPCRRILAGGLLVGMRDAAVICLEKVGPGETRVWEAGPQGLVDHGDAVALVRDGVAALTVE